MNPARSYPDRVFNYPKRVIATSEPSRLEFPQKDAVLTLRIPSPLLEAVRAKARAKGVPCARYVRMLLEADLQSDR